MAHQLVGRRPIKLTTIINTEGEEVEVERREDPEEKALADKIIGLFVEAGYFQINHEISLFHKFTSGMIWCLQSANYGFDTDSFTGFDEQTNIRNKIFLSEKIIRVLLSKTVKCPFVIQPHQILGLNVEHLFPLIKWLVHHCLQSQKQYNDDYLMIASQYLNTEKFSSSLLHVFDIKFSCLKKIMRLYQPFRNCVWNFPKKQKWDYKKTKREFKNVVYKNNEVDDTFSIDSSKLIPMNKIDNINNFTVFGNSVRNKHYRNLADEIFSKSDVVYEPPSLKTSTNIFYNIVKPIKRVDQEENITKKTYSMVSDLSSKKLDAMLDQLINLEQKYEEAKIVASQKKILYDQGILENQKIDKNHEKQCAINDLHEIEMKIDDEFGKINNEINVHTREDWSKGIEKQIYQERLNELQSQIIMATIQTKQHYAHYNTLIDIQAYKNKETNLLNSVIENYERAKSSKNYQDQYLKQLENVAEWVKQTKSKLSIMHTDARNKRNDMHKKWSTLMQIERDYAKVTRDIKIAVSTANAFTKHKQVY
ncbi:RNA-binding protein 39-like protein Caper isoform X2 [Arctopsyche grandis]